MTNHPNRIRRLRRSPTSLRAVDGTYCRECGGGMFIDEAGVSHHGSPKAVSYDDDADHVAVAEMQKEEAS